MTPQQIDALKLALEALDGLYMPNELKRVNKAITAINEVLAEHAMREVQRLGQEIEPDDIASILACRDMLDAQPVPPQPEQEPMLLFQSHRDGFWCVDLTCAKCYSADFRLKHTTPPQRTWVGLTDDEKNDCLVSADPCEALAEPEARQLIEDVEQALKERNQ